MKTTTRGKQLNVQKTPLSNGSTLYFKHLEGAPRIAMGVFSLGGNRVEAMPGIADMVDDLLNEGTRKRTAEDIAFEMDGLSLDVDTDTRRDYSMMNATFLEEDLEASLEMVSDLLYNSTLAEYEKEKVRLHGELMMEMDSPRSRSHDLFCTTILEGTPYQGTHSKILETIPRIETVDPLMSHYETVYQPENALFVVVGDIKPEQIQGKIEQYFVRGKGRRLNDQNRPEPPKLTESKYVTYPKDDSNQLHVFKGWYAPYLNHADYPAMVVMNSILGGAGLTSRLFIELRDKQGLAYHVRSQYEPSQYLGIFSIYIGTEPSNREKVLKGFEVEVDRMMNERLTEQEMIDAKENILGRQTVYLETAPQQCGYIGSQMSLGLTPEELDQLASKILDVTADQVQAVAQKYLSQPSVISAVGPSKFL